MDQKQVSPATPEGEPVTPQGVETPEFKPSQQGTQPESQTETEAAPSTPLTREDILNLVRTEATRIAQSQVNKGESRIQKQIQEKFAALEMAKGPLNLSPEAIEQAKQKIVTDAYNSPQEETQTKQETQQPPAPGFDAAVQFMNAQIGIVFQQANQTVKPGDPEFTALQKAIDDNFSDDNGLAKILVAADRAAQAKTIRLQKQQSTAAGRVLGGGIQQSGQGQQRPQSAHSAWEDAYKGS